ncbi:MAG: hypothetical protein WDW36_001273 [Sanguina aurantia]
MVSLQHSSSDIARFLPALNLTFTDATRAGATSKQLMQGLASRSEAYIHSFVTTPDHLAPRTTSGRGQAAQTSQHSSDAPLLQQPEATSSSKPTAGSPALPVAGEMTGDEQRGALQAQCVLHSHPVADTVSDSNSGVQSCGSSDRDASCCSLGSRRSLDGDSGSSITIGSDTTTSTSRVAASERQESGCTGFFDTGTSKAACHTPNRMQARSPASLAFAHTSSLYSSAPRASDPPPVDGTPFLFGVPTAALPGTGQPSARIQDTPTSLATPQDATQSVAVAASLRSHINNPTAASAVSARPSAAVHSSAAGRGGSSGTPTIAATLAHSQRQPSPSAAARSASPAPSARTASSPAKRPASGLLRADGAHAAGRRRSTEVPAGKAGQRGASGSAVRGSTLFCLLHTGSSDFRKEGAVVIPPRGINQSWSGCEPGHTVVGFDTEHPARRRSDACALPDPNFEAVCLSFRSAIPVAGDVTGRHAKDSSDGNGSGGSGSAYSSGGISSALATRTPASTESECSFDSSTDSDTLRKEAPLCPSLPRHAPCVPQPCQLPAISETRSHNHPQLEQYLPFAPPPARQAAQQQQRPADQAAQQLPRPQQQQQQRTNRHNQQHSEQQQQQLLQVYAQKRPPVHAAAASHPSTVASDSSLGLSMESALSGSTHAQLPSLSTSLNTSNGQHQLSSGQMSNRASLDALQHQPARNHLPRRPGNALAAAANRPNDAPATADLLTRRTLDWTRQMQQWKATDNQRVASARAPPAAAAAPTVSPATAGRASTDSVVNVLSFADMGALALPAAQDWPQKMNAWLRGAGQDDYGTDPRTRWWGVSGFFSEEGTRRLRAREAAPLPTVRVPTPELRDEAYSTLAQALHAIHDEKAALRSSQAAGQWPAFAFTWVRAGNSQLATQAAGPLDPCCSFSGL